MTSARSPLLISADPAADEYMCVTPRVAGWNLLHFAARRLKPARPWEFDTGASELGLVLLGGVCRVTSNRGEWSRIGRRPHVFAGMPYALYLPPNTRFTVEALDGEADVAYGWCAAEEELPPRLVTPAHVNIEIRGGGNATRQINSIFPPGFPCQRLVAVEVYTPAGNWSSYPPHKHDVHRENAAGHLIEADLEETYFYKFDHPNGFALQRVYTDDRSLDELALARPNDLVLVPEGYHPVAAAHGYTAYYLNFLAGSAQSLTASDDPEHAWIKETWSERDPRLPIVSMDMEQVGG
jgi:5-deoxy-glucuronate isomerase